MNLKRNTFSAKNVNHHFTFFPYSAQEDAEFDKLLPPQSQRCGSVHGTSQYPLQLYQYERWVRKQLYETVGFFNKILHILGTTAHFVRLRASLRLQGGYYSYYV